MVDDGGDATLLIHKGYELEEGSDWVKTKSANKEEQVIKDFGGMDGTIGNLASHCKKFPCLVACCEKAVELNKARQDFIHATFAADDKGQYVRFRELSAYTDLEKDIGMITKINEEVNSLIEKIDQESGSHLTDPSQTEKIIATVSAVSSY